MNEVVKRVFSSDSPNETPEPDSGDKYELFSRTTDDNGDVVYNYKVIGKSNPFMPAFGQ